MELKREKIDRKVYVKMYNTLYYEKNKEEILAQKKEARKILAQNKKPQFKIICEPKTLTFF
jgi:hypothetical protein